MKTLDVLVYEYMHHNSNKYVMWSEFAMNFITKVVETVRGCSADLNAAYNVCDQFVWYFKGKVHR